MSRHRGFTLVEMIIVIVITGIIAGMVAMFLRAPVQGYVDSERRAELTDLADTALRRIARDLRAAVPNSVRLPTPAGSTYLEFLPTRDGGRYRVNDALGTLCGAAGDDLDFDAPDSCFAIVGTPMDFTQGDAIIVGSAQSDGNPPYLPPGNANSVRRMVPLAGAGNGRTTVVITPSLVPFPASYEGYRFEVVPADQQAVTYACEGVGTNADGTGTGVLRRYWGYGFNAPQAAPPFASGSNAILVERVSACTFIYNTSNARNSLVAMQLTLTRGGESVNLYHEVHINNIP